MIGRALFTLAFVALIELVERRSLDTSHLGWYLIEAAAIYAGLEVFARVGEWVELGMDRVIVYRANRWARKDYVPYASIQAVTVNGREVQITWFDDEQRNLAFTMDHAEEFVADLDQQRKSVLT